MKRIYLVLAAAATISLAALVTTPASALGASSLSNAPVRSTSLLSVGFLSNFWDSLHQAKPTPSTAATPAMPATPAPAAVTPPATVKPQAGYAALGDSVAAGAGLPAVTPPTGNDALCGRSMQAYPYVVSMAMGMPLNHVACSGATVGDLFTKQGVSGPNITPQLDTAFAAGTPALITMTAGANDAHWDGFIRGCYVTACNNGTATFLANSYLTALQAKLYIAFTAINYRSAGHPPTVVVTGYYNPLSASCTQFQTNITADEITWLNAETAALNQTIANVASHYSFVKYAAVDMTGHDICSGSSWIQGLADPAPFHPTAAGQQAIAKSVLTSLGR